MGHAGLWMWVPVTVGGSGRSWILRSRGSVVNPCEHLHSASPRRKRPPTLMKDVWRKPAVSLSRELKPDRYLNNTEALPGIPVESNDVCFNSSAFSDVLEF